MPGDDGRNQIQVLLAWMSLGGGVSEEFAFSRERIFFFRRNKFKVSV